MHRRACLSRHQACSEQQSQLQTRHCVIHVQMDQCTDYATHHHHVAAAAAASCSTSQRLRTIQYIDMKRKASAPRPNRLSLAITSKLTSVFEKVEASRTIVSPRHLTIPIAEARLPFKAISSPKGLQEDFDSDILAELPTELYLIKENRYPGIRALRTDAEIGDGLWLCSSCRHENILRHYKGAFPFKYLRCDRCNHMLSPDCHTSAILSPIPYGMIHAQRPADDQEVRYCHVCVCGLSHRAEIEGSTLDFYGGTCAGCGTTSWGDWPRYHIGDNEPYRRDPDRSFAELVNQRAEDAARLAFRWIIANDGSRPVSPLGCSSSK